jgi:hypothetical protein
VAFGSGGWGWVGVVTLISVPNWARYPRTVVDSEVTVLFRGVEHIFHYMSNPTLTLHMFHPGLDSRLQLSMFTLINAWALVAMTGVVRC